MEPNPKSKFSVILITGQSVFFPRLVEDVFNSLKYNKSKDLFIISLTKLQRETLLFFLESTWDCFNAGLVLGNFLEEIDGCLGTRIMVQFLSMCWLNGKRAYLKKQMTIGNCKVSFSKLKTIMKNMKKIDLKNDCLGIVSQYIIKCHRCAHLQLLRVCALTHAGGEMVAL